MRAILFLTGAPAVPFDSCRHAALMPILDRPFVHHVVEALVDRGIDTIDFVLDDAASELEESLGNGERWGCSLRYHVPIDADRVGELFWVLGLGSAGDVLIGRGDSLPSLPLKLRGFPAHPKALTAGSSWGALDGTGECVAFMKATKRGAQDWTGWCLTTGRFLAGLQIDATQGDLRRLLLSRSIRLEVGEGLSVTPYRQLVRANRAVLRGGLPDLVFAGREVSPGVFVARSAKIPSSATLIAPVYVGEDTWVGANARLGPDAVIGSECVLDSEVTVADSVVMSGSYVGSGLEIRDAIVDGECFVSMSVGREMYLGDNILLGRAVPPRIAGWLLELLPRLVAVLLCVALAPPFVIRKLVLRISTGVRGADNRNILPANDGPPKCLCDLLCRVVPALPRIAMGSLSFVGAMTGRAGISGAMAGTKPGLITEAMVKLPPDASPEEVGVAEECYTVQHDPWYDLKLAGEYFAAALTNKKCGPI